MNNNLEQKREDTESWQETPYVSKYTAEMAEELEKADIKSRVAMKAFAVVGFGLFLSALTSHMAAPYYDALYAMRSYFAWAQVIFMLISGWVIGRDNILFAGGLYLACSVNTGILFSVIFQANGLNTSTEAFLVSAVVFCVMALIGYFTKKDLSTVGGIYGTVLLGIVLVTLLNFLVLHRSGFNLFLDYAIVVLFAGIIGYNMTGLRKRVRECGEENEDRLALFLGMQLYINFMNVYCLVKRFLSDD